MTRFILGLWLLLGMGALAAADTLRLAVTTSFIDSGLAETLVPEFEAETDIVVQLIAAGTGQALRLGAAGDVDGVVTHSPRAEREFVEAGHGPFRQPFMQSDYVIVGPRADPAQVGAAGTAAEALAEVARLESPFVSRSDNSGTHDRELALWAAADVEPAGGWYREIGAGMGAALNTAAAMDAYTLSDRPTWLNFGNRRDLILLLEGDPALANPYAFLPVSAERHPHVNGAAALRFGDWLAGERGRALISGYRIGGENPFTVPTEESEPE